MKDDYAIIIGINHYTPPDRLGLNPLSGAINDADEFEKWLSNPAEGDVPAANIKKIVSMPSPPADPTPLQDGIDNAFLEIETAILAKGGQARRLYFYFAGHGIGTTDSPIDTGLCLANWAENRRHSALSSESYKDNIRKYGYFDEIMFIADCCRNTKIDIKPRTPTFSTPQPGGGHTKLFTAYATQYQDQSYEVQAVDSEMRGAFTSVLLQGLKGAAANNGSIGADDLRDYLMKETPPIAQQMGYKQIPEISHSFNDNATIMVIAISQTKINIAFSDARNNPVELIDGTNTIIEIINPAQARNITRQLDKGLYMLRDTVTDDTKAFQVSSAQNNINVNF